MEFIHSRLFYLLHWILVVALAGAAVVLMRLDSAMSSNGPTAVWIPLFLCEFPCLGVMMVLDPIGKSLNDHFMQRLFKFVLSPVLAFGFLGPVWLRFCFKLPK